jgi:hypothetical protein
VSIEKKSLLGKKTSPSASPSIKKTPSAKAKVDTAKPATSKVIAALRVLP